MGEGGVRRERARVGEGRRRYKAKATDSPSHKHGVDWRAESLAGTGQARTHRALQKPILKVMADCVAGGGERNEGRGRGERLCVGGRGELEQMGFPMRSLAFFSIFFFR